jgi:hypothetical protein
MVFPAVEYLPAKLVPLSRSQHAKGVVAVQLWKSSEYGIEAGLHGVQNVTGPTQGEPAVPQIDCT